MFTQKVNIGNNKILKNYRKPFFRLIKENLSDKSEKIRASVANSYHAKNQPVKRNNQEYLKPVQHLI